MGNCGITWSHVESRKPIQRCARCDSNYGAERRGYEQKNNEMRAEN
jgi:hypothetical protein